MNNFEEVFEELDRLEEDLVTNEPAINTATLASRLFPAGHDLQGNITRLVPIRDNYNDTVLYDAITSMWMRIYRNLKLGNSITDDGWFYSDNDRVAWNFEYNSAGFIFTSTKNSFDVYRSDDGGRSYVHVIHSDHPHCTNAVDIKAVLDGNIQTATNTKTNVPVSTIRSVVKTAVENELRKSVSSAVSGAISGSIGSSISGAIGAGISGGSGYGSSGSGSSVISQALIDRIVDAVIDALQKNNII